MTVLERRDAEREGMASYLSVARGSEEPPKFIVLEYKGARKPPIATIHSGVVAGSVNANRIPVTTALQSVTVIPLPP